MQTFKHLPLTELNVIAQKMYESSSVDARTKTRVGVAVLIRDQENRILLEKRKDSSVWGFPGGRIEPGETIAQAAVREIFEETGLNVEVVRLLGVYSDPLTHIVTYLDNGDRVHIIDILLEAQILSGRLICSDESEMLAFFSENDLPEEFVPSTVSILEDMLNKQFEISPVIR